MEWYNNKIQPIFNITGAASYAYPVCGWGADALYVANASSTESAPSQDFVDQQAEISNVYVSTAGEDAFWIDKASFWISIQTITTKTYDTGNTDTRTTYQDNRLVDWDVDSGQGWCLSTVQDAYRGAWEHAVDPDVGCAVSLRFDLRAREVSIATEATIRRYVEPEARSTQEDWAINRAHDKGCVGTDRFYHVRCEFPDGSWSVECADMGSRAFLGQTMTRPPVRLSDRAWTEVAVDCPQLLRVGETVAWADGRAHDKGCVGTEHFYHVRCEFPDGNWSDKCRDMESRAFRGAPMTRPPARLPDRAWTEVAVACQAPVTQVSQFDWADGRAHDKGCRGNERIWHVRCEFSDGNWSDKCRDMESRAFRGLPMTRPPIRLSDRAWTEVAVACR